MIWKIFDGEMLIRTQPLTLLQIFCESMLDAKVIFKITAGPDDTHQESFRYEWVKLPSRFWMNLHSCKVLI